MTIQRKALDDLLGRCPECNGGPVFIDWNCSEDNPKYWAVCDLCCRIFSESFSANEVWRRWEDKDYYGS